MTIQKTDLMVMAVETCSMQSALVALQSLGSAFAKAEPKQSQLEVQGSVLLLWGLAVRCWRLLENSE